MLSTHIQNVPRRLGGSIGGPRYPRAREDGTGAHNTIWGVPWISNEAFTGLAYCLGGRSRQGSGHIALQAHHFGSRVQFRNLQIKKLP
ncbi:MAG: DUF1080 domain-containing protein [Actinomycetota bacterium]|nr:DUF1080 domain-containing protein [Actinomycetota bacterium]